MYCTVSGGIHARTKTYTVSHFYFTNIRLLLICILDTDCVTLQTLNSSENNLL